MTSKELMYVEDALSSEQHFQSQCCEVSNQLEDGELRSFAKELQQKHNDIFNSFYSLL